MTAGGRTFRRKMRGSFGDIRFEMLYRHPSERDKCIIGYKQGVQREVMMVIIKVFKTRKIGSSPEDHVWKEKTGYARIEPRAPEKLGLRENKREPTKETRGATRVGVKQREWYIGHKWHL